MQEQPTGRWELPLAAAVVVAVALAGSTAAVLPDPVLIQYWIGGTSYLAVAVLGAATCWWRGLRSTGRRRRFWLLLGTAQAVWSCGQALYLILSPIGLYAFPSWVDLFIVGSFVLHMAALLAYPSGGTVTRLRRLLDGVMATLAVTLVMWQAWLGPVIAAADPAAVLRSAASIFFPVAGTLILIIGVVALSHSPAGRLPLAMVVAGYTLLACGGIWYAQMQTGDDQQQVAGFAWNILGYACMALGALLRSDDEPAPDGDNAAQTAIGFLPYLPVAVAVLMSMLSYLRGTAGLTELWISLALVVLLMVRQYLTLRQNLRLTRRVQRSEEQLRHQAFHDPLTGLANRALFRDRLEHALALHARDMRPVALLFLDLDDFKVVNDTSGHAVGDQLLVRVAERLRGMMRTGDTVARLGGDEFAVLLEDDGDPLASAQRISDSLDLPIEIESGSVRVRGSIGVVKLSAYDAAVSLDDLLTRADTAMYQAKRTGKGRIVGHRVGMSLPELEDRRLRDLLAGTLSDGTFRVAYQPIVDVATGEVVAVEALARLRDESTDIRPEVFIGAAARTGILTELTDAVLRQAGTQVAQWSRRHGRRLSVHVNVLPTELGSPALMRAVRDLVTSGRLQPGQLVLEIAETALGAEAAAFQVALIELRAAGVRIALDDFGVGHSSLSRLSRLEIDLVKVDRSVLDRLDTNPRQLAIVESVLHLARRLDIAVIAEGVERPEQLLALDELGCHLAQGYLMGRPAPAAELGELFDAPGVPGQRRE